MIPSMCCFITYFGLVITRIFVSAHPFLRYVSNEPSRMLSIFANRCHEGNLIELKYII